MAWDSTVASGDTITSDEWNDMVSDIKTYWNHTNLSNIGSNTHTQIDNHIASNSNPHSVDAADVAAATTSTKLDNFATPDDNTDLNATTGHHGLLPKLGGGTTNYLRADGTWAEPAGGGTGFTPVVYPDNEEISTDGSNNIYFSGQGTTYVYSGLNSIIISSQIGSAGNLSDLTIDSDKDWNNKGIHNLNYISSQIISGGCISGGTLGIISGGSLNFVNGKIESGKNVDNEENISLTSDRSVDMKGADNGFINFYNDSTWQAYVQLSNGDIHTRGDYITHVNGYIGRTDDRDLIQLTSGQLNLNGDLYIGEYSISAQAISGGTIIGGHQTPLHSSKPTASDYPGQIIRVSGGSSEGTWVFMSVYNTSNNWEWIQIGMST